MESATDALMSVGRSRYVALTTYRKTGVAVTTPVWIARDGDRLLVWTGQHAGKVRRIRGNDSVALAPCTMSGSARGATISAQASILPGERLGEVFVALRQKYPVQFRFLRAYQAIGAILRGRSAASTHEGSVAIQITTRRDPPDIPAPGASR